MTAASVTSFAGVSKLFQPISRRKKS